MAYKVTLRPSGHEFAVGDDDTLLAAGLDAGCHLPYGCKNGACGACKARLIEGEVDHGAAMEHALPAEERNAGHLLLCCAKARSDLVVECREAKAADVPVKTLPTRVQKLERLAPDVMRMLLKLPSNERLQFLAGQYVEFLLADGKRRAFSLANAPQEDELLELHIRLVPGGSFTGHVFNAMKERDILRIEGPHGSFCLQEDSMKPIVLIAGGTGFAPIKSIVEYALHNRIDRPMALYWGARDRAGLYLPALPERWVAELPGFKYVPVLSEPTAADAWGGRQGLVHRAVIEDFADLSGHQVYVCGAPAMIDAARRDLVAAGLPAEEFFSDSFSFAPQ